MAAALIASLVLKARTTEPRVPMPGDRAPPLVLSDLQGQTRSLEEWRGKRVLLVFWAPGSAPAGQQARALGRGLPEGVVAVDVALDFVDTDEVVKFVGAAKGVHLLGRPAALVGWGPLTRVPMSFLIDENGVVVAVREGFTAAELVPR